MANARPINHCSRALSYHPRGSVHYALPYNVSASGHSLRTLDGTALLGREFFEYYRGIVAPFFLYRRGVAGVFGSLFDKRGILCQCVSQGGTLFYKVIGWVRDGGLSFDRPLYWGMRVVSSEVPIF